MYLYKVKQILLDTYETANSNFSNQMHAFPLSPDTIQKREIFLKAT